MTSDSGGHSERLDAAEERVDETRRRAEEAARDEEETRHGGDFGGEAPEVTGEEEKQPALRQ